MKTNKDEIRCNDRFFLVDTNDLDSFDEWVEILESMLNVKCSILEIDGKVELTRIKAHVANARGMKIEIYPKEHVPPHFHVKSEKVDASIKLEDCSLLKGKIRNIDLNKIKNWYKQGAKELLIEKWNSTRLCKCIVGEYEE